MAYADPFYQNLRTFINQNRASTGKRMGVNEAYGMTAGTMEPAYTAQQATAERALKREQFGVQAGQGEAKLALERAGQGIQQEQFGQQQALAMKKLEQERALTEESNRTARAAQESNARYQEAQKRKIDEEIRLAPYNTAMSAITGLGSLALGAASVSKYFPGAFSWLGNTFSFGSGAESHAISGAEFLAGDALPNANPSVQPPAITSQSVDEYGNSVNLGGYNVEDTKTRWLL